MMVEILTFFVVVCFIKSHFFSICIYYVYCVLLYPVSTVRTLGVDRRKRGEKNAACNLAEILLLPPSLYLLLLSKRATCPHIYNDSRQNSA